MNREETRAAIDVMQGHLDCKKIQYRGRNRDAWWGTEEYRWDWDENEYRIKPKSTIRPWSMAECPVGEKVIKPGASGEAQIVEKDEAGCFIGAGPEFTTYRDVLKNYTMLNGDPCGVREEGESCH